MEEKDSYSAEIDKRFATLPEDIKKLVYSTDMEAVLHNVGAKHGLHIDQIGDLETETVAVMIGLNKAEDFATNVADALEMDMPKSAALVKDINDQLFVKIRESLKKLYEKPAAGAIVNPPYTPPTPPTPPAPVAAPKPVPPPVPAPTPVPPALKPTAPAPAPIPPTTPKPTLPVEMHEALSKPVVSTPPPAAKEEAPKPTAYKADPYREIPE